MATVRNAFDLALQATSPRILPISLPTNVTVDLSNPSQVLNNLPNYTRINGVTNIATQSSLSLTGSFITGDLAANRIAAGSLNAGVVYAGVVNVGQLVSGSGTYDSAQVAFGLGVAWDHNSFIAGVNGKAYGASKLAGAFAQFNTNGFALGAAAAGGTGAAFFGIGGWNSITKTYTGVGYVGLDTVGGRFNNFATGYGADIGTPTYAINATGPIYGSTNLTVAGNISAGLNITGATISGSTLASSGNVTGQNLIASVSVQSSGTITAGTNIQATGTIKSVGAFGCNNATPQGKVTVGAAVSGTSLMETSAMVNLLRYILIMNGQAQA